METAIVILEIRLKALQLGPHIWGHMICLSLTAVTNAWNPQIVMELHTTTPVYAYFTHDIEYGVWIQVTYHNGGGAVHEIFGAELALTAFLEMVECATENQVVNGLQLAREDIINVIFV